MSITIKLHTKAADVPIISFRGIRKLINVRFAGTRAD